MIEGAAVTHRQFHQTLIFIHEEERMIRGIIVPYFLYGLCRALRIVVSPLLFFSKENRVKSGSQSRLGLEAGISGWEIREYQELFKSAVEYYGEETVARLFVDHSKEYLEQVTRFVKSESITHYGFSSRTCQEKGALRLFKILYLGVFFYLRGITPIVFLADFHNRRFRIEAIIISAFGGLVVTMVSSRTVKSLFPHRRIIGPHIMPFSRASAEEIGTIASDYSTPSQYDVVFSGSLYEPRKTTLKSIQERLETRNISFEILTRLPGGVRVPEEEYWKRMLASRMVITTADQTFVERGGDFLEIPHMVYRYLEVLLTGRLLVAPCFPGVEQYFVPDEEFLSFSSCEDAADKIEAVLGSSERLKSIQDAGNRKATELVASNAFWYGIESGLGSACIH